MIADYFTFSINGIRQRKMRSWLTMLGIFIGIAAVVSLISIGQGLQDFISDQFEMLGSDKIIIETKTMGPPGSVTTKSLLLTSKDLKVIEDVKGVKWAMGYLIKTGQATVGDQSEIGFAIGVNPEELGIMLETQPFDILEGRSLKKGDKFKAVVGYNHIYDKDGEESTIWKDGLRLRDTITIEGYEFKIIGVFEKSGNPYDDGAIYIPKETLREILEVGDEESQILVKTADGFDPEQVAERISEDLRDSRNEKEDQETFSVKTSEQLLDSFSSIFTVISAVLVGIAAISLLVGGVGIMNTMYTSVLERTKDIGTMKAIGAKNSDVLLIFLIESGSLGLVGGAIGVILGIGIAKLVEFIAQQALGSNMLGASISIELIIGALLFSFFVGAASGVLPARQASKLNPVDALRYE
jgi:putative ABC transport system permease protein